MKITFAERMPSDPGAVVAGVLEERTLSSTAAELDARTGGALKRGMAASRFTGAKDQFLDFPAPTGVEASHIVLAGLGKVDGITPLRMQEVGGAAVAHLNRLGAVRATVLVDPEDLGGTAPAERAANLAVGARLRRYRFDKYRTKEKEESKPTLKALNVVLKGARSARAAFGRLNRVADGVVFTRDLVSEPANVIHPESLAERARSLAELGVDVETLNESRLRKLGMGALLAVGQGSSRESRVVVMRWNGAPGGKHPPVAFVGKGVCFDTGGISLKPPGGMEEMKWDMAGAAVVMGLMKALAGRSAKVNAVGVAGLVENMPSGTAQRPGDVVTSMSGQTIEVINTDAEGRLVLADALWYCQDTFKPRCMIDLATLTGAIVVSLGTYMAGLFSNDDGLAGKIIAAGKAVGEEVWRMPLEERYDKDIDSDIADVKNVGKDREAGSIAGAQFLQRFVNDVPWAHLDIAGVTWSKRDKATVPKGGTAFGVRLLDRLVADHFETRR
ncbi:MAG: leucyl aminopeptidase [Alphaproteobacteria bacterium]